MPETRSLHLRCGQGWWAWRLRRGPPHALPSLVFVSSPGQTLASRCIVAISASIFTRPSFLCVSVFESLLHSLTRIPVIGFGAHPKSQTLSSLQPYWIWGPCFQMRSHPKVPGEHGFWGTLFNPLHQTETPEQSPHKPVSKRRHRFPDLYAPTERHTGSGHWYPCSAAVNSRAVPCTVLFSLLIR